MPGLVADPVARIEEPGEELLGGIGILVDGPREIQVSKRYAALGRSELRDLEDVVEETGALDFIRADLARRVLDFARPDPS